MNAEYMRLMFYLKLLEKELHSDLTGGWIGRVSCSRVI